MGPPPATRDPKGSSSEAALASSKAGDAPRPGPDGGFDRWRRSVSAGDAHRGHAVETRVRRRDLSGPSRTVPAAAATLDPLERSLIHWKEIFPPLFPPRDPNFGSVRPRCGGFCDLDPDPTTRHHRPVRWAVHARTAGSRPPSRAGARGDAFAGVLVRPGSPDSPDFGLSEGHPDCRRDRHSRCQGTWFRSSQTRQRAGSEAGRRGCHVGW